MADSNGQPVLSNDKYKGVKGWLRFLCILLVFILPLLSVVVVVQSYEQTSDSFSYYDGLEALFYAETVVILAIMGFGVFAGMSLWKMKQGAVKKTFIFLWLYLGHFAVFTFLYPMVIDFSSRQEGIYWEKVLRLVIAKVAFAGIWFWYLKKSKRVEATFN